ncbi:MAG: glycosyltransferase family 4 protein, partial [Candidatus Hodarchaeota archaeon]
KWMKTVLHEDFNFPLNNIYVVNNGVNHIKFHPKIKISNFIQNIKDEASGPIILFSGRMISTKGIHVLIEAIPKILNEITDAYFIFVGGGNSKPYKVRLKKYGISEKNYNFLGYIPDFDDMPGLYSIASVFAAPTLYENFPIRILENMSCKNPVIATNIVGIPEIIKNGFNGILIPPFNSNALAKNIIKLLDDKTLFQRIASNARKTVEEKFTLKIFAEKTLSIYKKILIDFQNDI